jgi:error-prone DNA polymerase
MDTSIEVSSRHEDPPQYAELCAKSHFSLLEGASHPEEMVQRANELGLSAMAIADSRGLYGAVRAHVAAKKVGFRFIVATEIPMRHGNVVLLVANKDGYRNVCRLLTRAHEGRPREEALLDEADLALHPGGLFAIVPTPSLEELRRANRLECDIERVIGPVREIFGERAFIATSRGLAPDDVTREASARAWSTRFGVPLIATQRPLFHDPARKPVADVLQCIREKTTLDQAGHRLAPNAEAYLRSPREMAHIHRDSLDRLKRTIEIADGCTFSLAELKYSFPCETEHGETPNAALARLVAEWAPQRYPEGVDAKIAQQLEKELSLIEKLDVAQFFLSVYEIVKIAREKGILCQGRGSAANSAVCFVLGITAVDPARSSLLFERFLSIERNEPPDIDVDFEHERREEVIQAIYEKYGRDRAAMVSEVICYRGKSALRETAKAFGLSLEQADRLTQMIGPHESVGARSGRLVELGFDPRDRRVSLVMEIAAEIQQFPRHMSTHVGGFVLSAAPLDEVAPIEPAKIPGRTVVPWDKDDIDALGFFKVDVLGLGMLTALRKALSFVHERQKPGTPFDAQQALADIPPEDSTVYDAICRADTIGVFQIESRAQMAMLPRMKPRKFYDLVIEVAIVRPGPIQGGMVHPYLRRRAKQEPPTLPHPSLGSILNRTLGVPLFQEQVMQIAIVGGGYTAGQADELRRDMAAWKRSARLLRHKEQLVQGFLGNGISAKFADQLFSQIQGFGEYGFPESHAASFALLVYASAYIKVHHPLEFACALLNAQPMGFYSASSIVRDAQKHGVTVLPPDVSSSDWDSTLEPHGETRALRLGLRLVKGMGEEPARRIFEARAKEAFRDIQDVIARTELRRDQTDALAEAGAFDSVVPERRQAMWKARAPDHGELFLGERLDEPEVSLPPMPRATQLRFDYARLGLSVDDHPMRHLRAQMKKRGVLTSEKLALVRHGVTVKVAGVVLSRQRPMTASGVVFVTLEDETGMINLILAPPIFDRSYRVAVHSRILWAKGRVERTPKVDTPGETPVIHVLASELEPVHFEEGVEIRSRDFR